MMMESLRFLITTVFVYTCLWQVVESAEETATGSQVGGVPVTSLVLVVGGLVCLVVVVAVCMGSKKVNPNVKRNGPPEWTKSLQYKKELAGGFSDLSDGMQSLGPNHIRRERRGQTVTDAARWSAGLTEGKHVFEVIWPLKKNRGVNSCIGVGSAEVPLRKQGRCSLIGEHSQSWGLDMSRQRSVHSNKVQQRLYRGVPDKFYMYIDMDSGKVGFGADVATRGHMSEFFGFICHSIPKNPDKPMYLMISCCAPNEEIQVFYRGTAIPSGGFDLVGGPMMIADQQQQGQPQNVVVYHVTNNYQQQLPGPGPAFGSPAPGYQGFNPSRQAQGQLDYQNRPAIDKY